MRERVRGGPATEGLACAGSHREAAPPVGSRRQESPTPACCGLHQGTLRSAAGGGAPLGCHQPRPVWAAGHGDPLPQRPVPPGGHHPGPPQRPGRPPISHKHPCSDEFRSMPGGRSFFCLRQQALGSRPEHVAHMCAHVPHAGALHAGHELGLCWCARCPAPASWERCSCQACWQAQLRLSRTHLDTMAALGQDYWHLASSIHRERLAIVTGLQQVRPFLASLLLSSHVHPVRTPCTLSCSLGCLPHRIEIADGACFLLHALSPAPACQLCCSLGGCSR